MAALCLAALAILLAVAHPFRLADTLAESQGDHTYYIRLATGGPEPCDQAPYCWRVLQPMLVRALPFDVETGFRLVTSLCLWLTGIALYYLIKSFGFSGSMALVGVLLFYSFGWGAGFLLFYFWMSDGMVFLLLTLAILCARKDKAALFMCIVAVGAGVKESMLLALPLYYTLNARSLLDWKLAAKSLLLALPAVAVLLLIRLSVPITNNYDLVAWLSYFLSARADGRVNLALVLLPGVRPTLPGAFVLANIATFGVALLLPFLAPKRNLGLLIRFLLFLLMVNGQLLIAEATERLIIYAFPAVILMSLNGLESIAIRFRLGTAALLPLPVAWFIVTLSGRDWQWTFLNWQGLALAAWLVGLVLVASARSLRNAAMRRAFG